jgi:hypothetical protein
MGAVLSVRCRPASGYSAIESNALVGTETAQNPLADLLLVLFDALFFAMPLTGKFELVFLLMRQANQKRGRFGHEVTH